MSAALSQVFRIPCSDFSEFERQKKTLSNLGASLATTKFDPHNKRVTQELTVEKAVVVSHSIFEGFKNLGKQKAETQKTTYVVSCPCSQEELESKFKDIAVSIIESTLPGQKTSNLPDTTVHCAPESQGFDSLSPVEDDQDVFEDALSELQDESSTAAAEQLNQPPASYLDTLGYDPRDQKSVAAFAMANKHLFHQVEHTNHLMYVDQTRFDNFGESSCILIPNGQIAHARSFSFAAENGEQLKELALAVSYMRCFACSYSSISKQWDKRLMDIIEKSGKQADKLDFKSLMLSHIVMDFGSKSVRAYMNPSDDIDTSSSMTGSKLDIGQEPWNHFEDIFNPDDREKKRRAQEMFTGQRAQSQGPMPDQGYQPMANQQPTETPPDFHKEK